MTSRLAVTVVGHDHPGIIARVASVLAGTGMNLEDSSMTLLRGHFAMTLICAGEADAGTVSDALSGLADDTLSITVLPTPADTPATEAVGAGGSVLVSVHGADRLGIVARLTQVVADAGGNITDLTTRLAGDLYVLTAEVDLPLGDDADVDTTLTEALQTAAAELGVRVTVRPADRDDL